MQHLLLVLKHSIVGIKISLMLILNYCYHNIESCADDCSHFYQLPLASNETDYKISTRTKIYHYNGIYQFQHDDNVINEQMRSFDYF